MQEDAGGREELAVSVSSAAVVSCTREPGISGAHHPQDVLGTNARFLLSTQNGNFLFSVSESCSPEMEHLAYNQHGTYLQLQSSSSQGIRVWSWHFCAAVSQPCWLLGSGGCFSTFPKWKEKQKPQYSDDDEIQLSGHL